ncbi:hypothetical protein AB0C52_02115 [Streptomyces sp. NPDC048717]|uniref:bacteriocin-associated integral membrane family protein n=1 Tax=Streptomyces sp. NPDC048717 TaxID=3154928 RepID=UPI003436F654
MLHRSIKFVHAAVLAFSAVLSFLFLRDLDARWVMGHSAVVWVTDTKGTVSGTQVAALMGEYAERHQVAIARETPDLKEPYSRRHLYLATGGPHADWLTGGYPAFDQGYRTDVHPVSDLGNRDPRGYYYIFGPDRAAVEIADIFTGMGLEAGIYHPYSVDQLTPVYADSALLRSLFVVALAVVTMTGAGIMLNAKAYGVQRLQGRSFGRIIGDDLRQLTVFWSVALLATAALSAAVLGVYNGLAWFSLFGTVALGFAVVLGLVSLAVHAITLQLTFRTGVLRALKGELPARTASISTYLVRVPALLLAVAITGDVVSAGQNIADREQSAAAYQRIGEATSITLSGSVASENGLKELTENVGAWLHAADRDGQVVFVGHRHFRNERDRTGLPDRDLLVVNESYLAAQPIRDADGHRLPATTGDDPRIRLLVPAGLERYTDKLTGLVPGNLNPGHPEQVPADKVTPVRIEDGQRHFTYNPRARLLGRTNPGADESYVRDAVIVVFPDGAPYVSDRSYMSYASQQSLVFKNPDDVTTGITAHHLEAYVTGVSPVGAHAAVQLRDLVGEFRLQLFNLAVAVLVLLITGVGACIVHSRKNAQAIFARHISGWRFAAVHRPLLILEGVLAAFLLVWVPVQVWRQNQAAEEVAASGKAPLAPHIELSALDLTANAGLVVAEVAAVLLALALFHRRIVKEGASEA